MRDRLYRSVSGIAQFGGDRDVALRELGAGLVDPALDVGDQRRQAGHRAIDVGRCAVHRVQERAGLAERGFGGVDGVDQSALPVGRSRHQLACGGDVLVGERQALPGLVDVVGHRDQRRLGELRAEPAQRLFRRCSPRRQVDHLAGHGVQSTGCVDHQVTHLGERLPLGFELPVGLGGGDDDAGEQITTLRRGLGHRVVEDVPDVERLGQRGAGVGHRAGERLGVPLAEFLDGQGQLAFAGTHLVVDVDDDLAGQVVERLEWHRGQRAGVCRVDPLRRGEFGLPPLAPPATLPQHEDQQCQPDDRQSDEYADPADRAATAGTATGQALGCGDRGAGPVPGAQQRLDVVAADLVDVDAAHRVGGREQCVGAVDGGHRQNRVLAAQIAAAVGGLRPRLGVLAGEVLDEHHPQPDALVVVEPVDRLLHLALSGGVQRSGVVGQIRRQPERRFGHRGRGGEQSGEQTGEQHGQQAGETHGANLVPPTPQQR